MSMSDPLGDMITRIRNGQSARKTVISTPASKLRSNVLEVLKREGYIRDYSAAEVRPGISEKSCVFQSQAAVSIQVSKT